MGQILDMWSGWDGGRRARAWKRVGGGEGERREARGERGGEEGTGGWGGEGEGKRRREKKKVSNWMDGGKGREEGGEG